MPKILKKNIIAIVMLIFAVAFGAGVGVVATNNAKKIDFNIGVQHIPEFKIEVQLKIGEEYKTIFNSNSPASIERVYIDNIVGNTLNLKNSYVENQASLDLKFISHETGEDAKAIEISINQTVISAGILSPEATLFIL